MKENQIHLWALGGCGSEIMSAFEPMLRPGLELTYVDTSRSNIRDTKLTDENIFIFRDEAGNELDGSGKLRAENADLIVEQTPSILNKHKPGHWNIVSFGLSGGSGSVAGPVLIANLLERGCNVAVVGVSSFDDGVQTINARDTFKGLRAAAVGLNRVVLVNYNENGKDGKTEDDVNDECRSFISELIVLFSGENRRLDTADLHNFLNYPLITKLPVTIAEITSHQGYDWVEGNEYPIAFCSLYPENASKVKGVSAIVSYEGYVPTDSPIKETTTFTITTDHITGIINTIDAQAKHYEELASARKDPVISTQEEVDAVKGKKFLVL